MFLGIGFAQNPGEQHSTGFFFCKTYHTKPYLKNLILKKINYDLFFYNLNTITLAIILRWDISINVVD